MFKKLKRNMVVLNMTIISVAVLISFLIIYLLTVRDIKLDNQNKIDGFQFSLITNLRKPYEENKYIFNNTNSFTLILDKDKKLSSISSSLEVLDSEYYELLLSVNIDTNNYDEINFNNSEWLYKITELGIRENERGFYYKVSFLDISASNDAIDSLLLMLISTFFGILIVIYFISLYFAKKAVKPLEISFLKQKQFIADATHELKTPLTIINSNIEAIKLNESELVKEQFRWLDYMKEETKSMNKLINELLNSARIEEETLELYKVDLSNLINNYILTLEATIYEKNIKLNIDIEENINILSNDEKILQVLKILIDNAIKYNKTSGFINIKLKKDKKYTYLSVENSGNKIEETDIKYIFDRFYKVEKSRTDNSFGLGLYIAKSIITKLKGTITVSSNEEKTTFIIKI